MVSETRTMKDIAKTLETKAHLNFYASYYSLDTKELAKALNEILINLEEIEKIKTSETYKHNVVDMVQFIYSKYLSERKEQAPSIKSHAKKKTELFSEKSLETLYSIAS